MRRHGLKAACAALGVLAGTLLAGCPQAIPDQALPLGELVGRYNNNAALIQQLWARARLEVSLADSAGRRSSWGSLALAPNGLLLLAKQADPLAPPCFVLVGQEAGHDIFRLGSSPAEPSAPPGGVYYFWAGLGQKGGAWYGLNRGGSQDAAGRLPIDPRQLLAVLGVFELPEDFTKLPTVALSMSASPPAYVVTYLDGPPAADRIAFCREVHFRWSTTEPPRPFQVNFFDATGRRVMTARLKDYQPIDIGEGKEGIRPEMPTDIDIESVSWPGLPNSPVQRIHIVLSRMTTQLEDLADPREACLFFGPNLPAGIEVHRVDAPAVEGAAP